MRLWGLSTRNRHESRAWLTSQTVSIRSTVQATQDEVIADIRTRASSPHSSEASGVRIGSSTLSEGSLPVSIPSHQNFQRTTGIPLPAGPEFQRRSLDFFKVGRVFGVKSGDSQPMSLLAVVQEYPTFCKAILIVWHKPDGQSFHGLKERAVQAHAIIYTDPSDQHSAQNGPKLRKEAIAVDPDSSDKGLDRGCHIDFSSRSRTVECTRKIFAIGVVAPDSMPYFQSYWRQHHPAKF